MRVVEARGIQKKFVVPGPWPWSPKRQVQALAGVDLQVEAGEIVALVGRSGSGKTTLARILLALEHPDAGEVLLEGAAWSSLSEPQRQPLRVQYQYVPQDAMSALDPQQTPLEAVTETLRVLAGQAPKEAKQDAEQILVRLGLGERLHALPRQLSGGEQRRVTLARVFALKPRLIVADEPTSGLEPDRREQVMKDLVENLPEGAACVWVTHDLAAARRWSHRTVVMLGGEIVEQLPSSAEPQHPYAAALFDPWSHDLP